MINYQLEEIFNCYRYQSWGFPGGTMVKHPPANAGDTGSISGSGRSLGEGNGNPLQYSCLKNSIDRGAYSLQGYVDYSLYGLQAIVHRVAQSNMRERQHTHHTQVMSQAQVKLVMASEVATALQWLVVLALSHLQYPRHFTEKFPVSSYSIKALQKKWKDRKKKFAIYCHSHLQILRDFISPG